MSSQIALVFIFTFVIHLISTLAYSVRIAGARTGRVAVSLSLFNILILFSRTANSLQGPLLAKHVEEDILRGTTAGAVTDFRWVLFASTLATIIGGLLIPTAQRLFSTAVEAFDVYRSIPRLVLRVFTASGLEHIRQAVTVPAKENILQIRSTRRVPVTLLVANTIGAALLSVGVLASLYAGYLTPELRSTSSNLSALANGFSTILLMIFIDPYLSVLTDDVANKRTSGAFLRKCVMLFAVTRLIGTVLAQFLLVPAAHLIALTAHLL